MFERAVSGRPGRGPRNGRVWDGDVPRAVTPLVQRWRSRRRDSGPPAWLAAESRPRPRSEASIRPQPPTAARRAFGGRRCGCHGTPARARGSRRRGTGAARGRAGERPVGPRKVGAPDPRFAAAVAVSGSVQSRAATPHPGEAGRRRRGVARRAWVSIRSRRRACRWSRFPTAGAVRESASIRLRGGQGSGVQPPTVATARSGADSRAAPQELPPARAAVRLSCANGSR